jgi:tetratricopeptide (TPR) repeat protein
VASARRVSKRDQSSVQSRKPAIIKETCDYGEEPTVSVLTVFRCVAGAVLASAAATFPAALAARAQAPTQQELSHTSPSGNYLAARQANVIRDAASAAAYYRAALKSDPKNADLLELAFYAELAGGDVEEAVKLADRLVVVDRNNRNAHLVLGVRALKQKQFPAARTQFAQSMRGPITDLTGTLLTAWTLAGTNDVRGAIETIDRLSGPDWYAIFKDLHAGLILDLSGNKKEAGKRFEAAYKLDPTALRVAEAYGRWTSRNVGKPDALKIYQTFNESLPHHPLIMQAMDRLKKGESLPLLVDGVQAGAAEVLYGLGAALGRREEELSLANRGLAYLQLALHLEPQHTLALLSIADLHEAMKNPQAAIKVYDRIPEDSILKRNADIQQALDLDSLERTDEAKRQLEKLISNKPDDLEAILALGNILRDRKQYAECADVYGKAVALITKPERNNWTVFYFRGICYERAKNWPKSEADLKRALELFPDQPHVLNYLGYSWVDQGVNLDEGVRMIKRSVEQRPDDGYIVDSLGWAYERLGNFDEAVKHLERAVELKPMDPTINDHLGDVYWKVGRRLEARFQWAHARDLKPDPADLEKIEKKLKVGMVEEPPSSSADADKPKKPGDGG